VRKGQRGDFWQLAAPLVVLVASSFAFLQLSEDYVEDEWVVDVDRAVARWMREHSGASPADAFETVTVAGSVAFLAAAVLAAASILAARRRLAAAVMLPLSFSYPSGMPFCPPSPTARSSSLSFQSFVPGGCGPVLSPRP
jgi:hypothetical protein